MSNCWGFFSKKIKTETRFISETTPGFLWPQIELKNSLILNKGIHILILHFFSGTRVKRLSSTLVLLDQKIASSKIFRQTFCCICFPFQRQRDEDIPAILWYMGVSRRIIFR